MPLGDAIFLKTRLSSQARVIPSKLRFIEQPVSQNEEHFEISYGSAGTDKTPFPTVTRVSAPRDDVINLEFLLDYSTTLDSEILASVRRKVNWLFLEKGKSNHWGMQITTARQLPTSTATFT